MTLNRDFVFLETLRKNRHNRRNLFFEEPVDIITCLRNSGVHDSFRKMENYLKKGFYLAGFFSYELGYALEKNFGKMGPSTVPLLWVGVFEKPLHRTTASTRGRALYYFSKPKLESSWAKYRQSVVAIKQAIAEGQTYQINFTTKYLFRFFGDVFHFYAQLKSRQKVPYAALISFDGRFILSLSPELFFRIDQSRRIVVEPMKGTAAPDRSSDWLYHDPKNRSENVMIVDLLRNDLGRICQTGSVRVHKLFNVEKYETLWQMTSTVTGRLRDDVGLFDIMKSLFPCGSVTGAPKISSMKILRTLEQAPRGVYTGAIGYFAPDGSAAFNVAIRTICLNRPSRGGFDAEMGVGSGIVFDSKAKAEYEECRLKAKFLIDAQPDFALIETMLCEEGQIKWLNRHLARLEASAVHFSVPFSFRKTRMALIQYVETLKGPVRIRLRLTKNGEMLIERAPVLVKPEKPEIAISRIRTFSGDPFLYHKTTFRRLYDEEYRKGLAAGYFDVIFRNEHQQITEGAVSNIFIERQGQWYTPAVRCGLLAGLQRAEFMRKFKARETVLHERDLREADRIVLTNAVRGVTDVVLKG
jgi:para-aminobenzoate synthetase/4-amino-4-deoxychorismate lyase